MRHSGRQGVDRPRILQVIGSGDMGGGTTMVLNLSRSLAERNFDVIIASHRDSYLLKEARSSNIPTLALDFSRRGRSLKLASDLKCFIEKTKTDLVHAHGPRAGLPVALAPQEYRIPSVYTVHGFHFPIKAIGVKQMAREVERFCMTRTQATIFVCQSDRNLAESSGLLPRDRGSIIYNGAEVAHPGEEEPVSPCFDIAFLGRLCPQKNPLILTEILLAMRPARPTLAIIGGGELESALRREVADAGLTPQVRFLGLKPHAEGLRLLRQAKAMLLPSISEGLPLAVIEAMHLGIPTVASRVGGTPELIAHGETGFLVDPFDVDGFASYLRVLLDDQSISARMASHSRERAQALFSHERNVSLHASLYQRLLMAAS